MVGETLIWGGWELGSLDRAVGEDDRGPPACSDLLSCLAQARRTSPEKKDGASSAARLQPPSHLLVDADLLVDLGKRLVEPTCCRIAMEGRSDGAAPLPVEEAACSALPTAAGEDGFFGAGMAAPRRCSIRTPRSAVRRNGEAARRPSQLTAWERISPSSSGSPDTATAVREEAPIEGDGAPYRCSGGARALMHTH
ncbi:hypothetical protein ACLOJK_014876 [Asimina triloba]